MLLEDNKGDLTKRAKLILVHSCANLFHWICNADGVNEQQKMPVSSAPVYPGVNS